MYPKDNAESWQQIHELIKDAYPDDGVWPQWKKMARDFISELEAHGLAEHFRIGQSHSTIVFSTLEHHQLGWKPRVMLEFDPRKKTVRIAYSCRFLVYGPPITEETFPISAGIPNTLRYLRHLWAETKSTESLPKALDIA